MANLVPILLKTGQRAMVPREDMDSAMADPLAAPISDIMNTTPGQRLRPVLLHGGRVAQVPAEDYETALGDPLAHGDQGQATIAVPLQNGRSARVPLNDVGDAMRDPLARRGPDTTPQPQIKADAEDEALAELAGAMDYAGIGKPTPMRATEMQSDMHRSPTRRPVAPQGESLADVDALGAVWDDFYSRSSAADAPEAPSAMPLASRMGGDPLPRPAQRTAVASPSPGPQQGPVFGEGDTLQDAQKRASLMRGLSGVGKGMSRIGGAIAGVNLGDGASADMERGADSQVRDYLQRKQQGEAEKASAQQAALKDPASPESQRFQAMVSRAFGSVYSPEQIKSMTAADAPLVGKYGEMVRTLEDRAARRAAEQESQQAQLTARATETEKQRAFEGKQNAANRANAREIAGMRQGAAGDKAAEAFDRKMSERNVGGFEIDPSNPPTAEGAKNMAGVVEARENIKGSLDRLEELFNEYGTEMGGGTAQSGMEAELGNITTQLRLFNKMGVPNLNDYAELGKQIPQTAGVGAWFSRDGSIRTKFHTLRDQLDRAVSSTARTYKFKPTGGPQRVGMHGNMDVDGPPPAPPGMLNIRLPDGSAKQIPAERRTEAERDYGATVI